MKTLSFLMAILCVQFSQPPGVLASTLSFELAGNLIILKGSVNGQYGNFILDTGVPDLILNKRYFKGDPSDHFLQGINGQMSQVEELLSSVEFGEVKWKNVLARIIPMLQLEATKSIPIHGLLGSAVFQDYFLLIDYEHFLIELIPIDKKGESAEFQFLPAAIILPFKDKGGAPLIDVQLGDLDLRLTIDTGAEVNLVRKKYENELASYEEGVKIKKVGGLGDSVKRVKLIGVTDLNVAGLLCQPQRLGIVDLDRWNRTTYGPSADGILGYEFLKQFTVGINYKKKELYLWEFAQPVQQLLASEKR